MSIEAKIATLKSIAALDAELLTLENDLKTERSELEQKAGQRSSLDVRIRGLSVSISEMEKTRGELLGELRQQAQQVERAREKMARCRNEREANAAQREIEELRRIHREREKEIEKLAELLEQARSDSETAKGEQQQVASEIDENAGSSTARAQEIESQIAKLQAERATFADSFENKALLRRYDTVRQRRGSGLALVVNGNCTACHIGLPPMVYQQMMHRKELHTCPSCLRILYLGPLPSEGVSENEP